MIVAPNLYNIASSLRSLLLAVLPSTGPDNNPLDVILAQTNRIPAPRGSSYVVMTPLRQERLETNIDSYSDAVFTGSISGTSMTITAVDPRFPDATLKVGSTIFGAGIATGTTVTGFVSGTGQLGTYTVSPSQNIGSETISAGTKSVQIAQKVTFQLDFHAADDSSGDLANIVCALLRDEFATNQFANQVPNYGISPLLAEDPRQMPFHNDQQQVEFRWVVEALLQANVVVSVPQQFADTETLTVNQIQG